MQIAVFIKRTTLHSSVGGLETQNKLLCEGLVKKGHSVTVFSPRFDLTPGTVIENGVTYVFVDCVFRSLAGFSELSKDNWHNRSVDEFKKLHDKNPFDIVLGQSSAALGIISKKEELGVPVISIAHGTITGEYKTRLQSLNTPKDWIRMIPDTGYLLLNFFRRQRHYIWHSNKVIAVSQLVKKNLIDETFVPESKLEVVYNGIDTSSVSYEKPSPDSNNIKLTYVGLIHQSKGLGDLIRAVSGIDNVHLSIIGKGPHKEDLISLVERKKLSDKILFMDSLLHENLLRTYKDYDIFVLPSRRMEGFPMTTVEAMFAGLPSIVSDMGGTPEAVEDGVTGFVIESGNIRRLKEKIVSFVQDPNQIVVMGEAARKRALNLYSLDKMVDTYEEIMQKVIK